MLINKSSLALLYKRREFRRADLLGGVPLFAKEGLGEISKRAKNRPR